MSTFPAFPPPSAGSSLCHTSSAPPATSPSSSSSCSADTSSPAPSSACSSRDAWSWRSYLLHRLVRLWIVLVPGLTLAALCDGIGLHLHRAPAVALYSGTPGNLIQPHNIAASFHLSIWLGNLAFLQNTFIPIFGSDAPLWSLANEFWYYILFPLGLLALRRQTPLAARLLCLILFATIALTLDRAIIYVFPVWLLGTLLSVLPAPRFTAFWRTAAAIVYVPVLLFFGHFRTIHTILADQIFGLITFGFLYVLLSAHAPTHERHLTTRLWRTLARFSYTLYVVHLPFLLLIAALILPATRWIPNPIHIAYAAAFFVLALAYAYILAFFTEFRTDALRKAIERRLP